MERSLDIFQTNWTSIDPRTLLRVEGLGAFVLAVAGYVTLEGPIWLLVVLALAPDLAMIGYLAGTRVGSYCYNAVHTYTGPFTLGGVALWADSRMALLVALIWADHIGADRFVGYGLTFESGFKDTHLSTQPAPVAAFESVDK